PLNLPVSKRHNIAVEDVLRLAKRFCVQCAYCTEMCPRYLLGHPLEPHRIMRAFAYGIGDLTLDIFRKAYLCCECGVCSLISCPMGLSPMHVNRWLKNELAQRGLRYESPDGTWKARPNRAQRLVPLKVIVRRLGIKDYDQHAAFKKFDISVQEVRLLLKQHVGNPAIPKVKPGDQVKKGDVVGEVVEGIGALLHASIDGVVTEVTSEMIVISREKK
ncbi:MAG: 4Fe-4S dicluster domain-containing protein, partial [Thermacetogeniaceae bacterium]